ncbi:MAG: hypothetical protein GF344_04450 [Chitinivibrionales bacterium]|nr:hypothetical protein [Chitinivibrionales bacterium]
MPSPIAFGCYGDFAFACVLANAVKTLPHIADGFFAVQSSIPVHGSENTYYTMPKRAIDAIREPVWFAVNVKPTVRE